MALRHSDLKRSQGDRSTRTIMRVMRILLQPIVPLLRVSVRMLPPLRAVIRRSTGAMLGAVFDHRDRGDHRAAYDAAIDGLERHAGGDELRALHWWTFLDLASREAAHLGEPEQDDVMQRLEAAEAPGGVQAAWCLQTMAGWMWERRDTEAALRYAKQAVIADSSCPDAHVFLGWLGLVTGRLDPLPHLREALRVDASAAEAIRANADLSTAPGLLKSLGLGEEP